MRKLAEARFRPRGYSRWRKAMIRRGFRFVREEGICWFPFGRQSNSPLVPPAVATERLLDLWRLTAVSPWVVYIAQKQNA